MRIVLIGYRGTGKSVVGVLVAARLGVECVSMDDRIVEKAGLSIPEIVERHGWPAFRDLESEVARELSEVDQIVVDTGGGVIERGENTEALGKNGLVIWLRARVDTIVERIESGSDRPALTPGRTFTEEVAEVLAGRIAKYQAAAQYEIDTDELTAEEVSDRVIEIWQTEKRARH